MSSFRTEGHDTGHLLMSGLSRWTGPGGTPFGLSAAMIMESLYGYVFEATEQMARIQTLGARVTEPTIEWDEFKNVHLRFEHARHFYLTCWTMVWRAITAIHSLTKHDGVRSTADFSALDQFVGTVKPELEKYNKARDFYEHYDDKVRDLYHGRPTKEPAGSTLRVEGLFRFTLAGGELDLDMGPASLSLLQAIIKDFEAAVRPGAEMAYVAFRKSEFEKEQGNTP